MRELNIINKLIFLINSICLLALLLSYSAQFLNPNIFWPISFLGLLFPLLFILNTMFLIYWIVQLKKQLWANLIILLIGIQYIDRFVGIQANKKNDISNIKVLSYNVRLFNAYNWLPAIKKEMIYNFIKEKNADIVCIQEFYNNNDSLMSLGYNFNFFDSNKKHLAIYSKYQQINQGQIRCAEEKNQYTCIYTDLIIEKDTIRIYNIHLASNWFDNNDYSFINRIGDIPMKKGIFAIIRKMKKSYKKRANQIAIIKENMQKSPYPIIVCGDFNDTPISYTYHKIKDQLIDGFTTSGIGIGKTYVKIPALRIDYIMHDKKFNSYNYKKYNKILSDHYAISCEINIKPEKKK